MLKVTIPKIVLTIFMLVFSLHLSGLTVAEECWDGEGGGPTFTGNHTYTPNWHPAFQYDPNNPDEIDRNNTVAISVIGGFSPYTWQVSGNGFSLSLNETEVPSNALYANDTACGSATITVTDNYGATVTGYVRCTEGQWIEKEMGMVCGLGDYCKTTSDAGCQGNKTIIQGNKNWFFNGSITYAVCLYPSGGECTADMIQWDTEVGHEETNCGTAMTNLPPCGSPVECNEGTCTYGPGIACLYARVVYYEWECAP